MTWAVMSFVCHLQAPCRQSAASLPCQAIRCLSVMVTITQRLASAPHVGESWNCMCWLAMAAVALIAQLRRRGLVRVKLPFGDTHLAELPDGRTGRRYWHAAVRS